MQRMINAKRRASIDDRLGAEDPDRRAGADRAILRLVRVSMEHVSVVMREEQRRELGVPREPINPLNGRDWMPARRMMLCDDERRASLP